MNFLQVPSISESQEDSTTLWSYMTYCYLVEDLTETVVANGTTFDIILPDIIHNISKGDILFYKIPWEVVDGPINITALRFLVEDLTDTTATIRSFDVGTFPNGAMIFNNAHNQPNIGETFRRNHLTDDIIGGSDIYTQFFVDFTYTLDASNIQIEIGEIDTIAFNKVRGMWLNIWVFAYDTILLYSHMGDEINYNEDEMFGVLTTGDVFFLTQPQASIQLDNTGFTHSTSNLNEGMSFERNYAKDKVVFIYQITLYPKNLTDPLDNHETHFYYRVY